MGTRGRLPPGPIGGRDCLVREGNSSRKMSDRQTVGTIATVATYGLTASIRFHVPSTVTFGLKPSNSLRTYWLPPPAQAGPYWLLNSTGIGIAERLHTADCLVPLVRFRPNCAICWFDICNMRTICGSPDHAQWETSQSRSARPDSLRETPGAQYRGGTPCSGCICTLP